MSHPVVHFEIGCRDRDRSEMFYTRLFEWGTSEYGPLSRKIDTGSPLGIQGHITALGHEPHSYVTIYVEVADIDKQLAQVEELGGKVVIPATDVPGQGRFAWISDPDENIVGLWTPL